MPVEILVGREFQESSSEKKNRVCEQNREVCSTAVESASAIWAQPPAEIVDLRLF